jgi:death-on-curing protein
MASDLATITARMGSMQRIEIGDFLLIAEAHTGIDAKQLARMPRVLRLASAAIAAPFAGFGDFELFPLLHAKAAVYCSRIVRYHPLPDGNTRAGYDVMREFLDRNGAVFKHPPDGLDGTADTIERLTSGDLDEAAFIEWVQERLA